MSEFAPPTGPPPPRDVPEGWKAIWNAQYSEWFFVNIYTKESTWEKPTQPAHNPDAPPPRASSDMPPSYNAGATVPHDAGSDIKKPIESNNPYQSNVADSDAAMAKRLQDEENARHTSAGPGHADNTRGTTGSYYNDPNSYPNAPNYDQQQYQQQQGQYQQQQGQYQQQQPQYQQQSSEQSRGKSGGFLSKLKEKIGNPPGGHSQRPMGAPMMGYNAGGYPSHQGGYPQQGYGQGMPMMQQGYGRYGQQPMYMPHKKKGMGAGGAAALGVGGGLIGGMMIANGIDDMQDDAYEQGFDDGGGMDDMGGDF